MLIVKGLSDKPCIFTGKTENTVEAGFKDRTFQGVIEWGELLKVIRRKTAEAKKASKAKARDQDSGERTPDLPRRDPEA